MKFCNRPFEFMYMLPGGDIWTCSWMHLSIGNILKEDVMDIWHSENARLARESILDGSFRYCRKESCPFCENDSLPDVTEDELAYLAVASEAPKEINAAFDYTCNHSCPSCRQHIYKHDSKYMEELDITINKILPYMNKVKMLSTNGNGDVFASRRMMDMLADLRPENPSFELNLETNGVLFDEPHWEKIAHLGKFHINATITPNSFERDTFRYLSGGHDNLDKLISNLHFVKSLRNDEKINSLAISIVVQDRNFRELPSFTRRCLDEFGADQVVIKPVYQWFGMKEDVYWFKNVRNPLHPYHGEWLEMMKDPILDDPRVFHWGGRNVTEAKFHPAYRYQTNQEILLKLFSVPNPGERLKSALGSDKAVAVCAPDDETGLLLANMLKNEGMRVCFLRRFTPKESENNGLPSYGFPNMDFASVDTIVITDHYNLNKLTDDIRNHDFTGHILSFAQLCEMLEG